MITRPPWPVPQRKPPGFMGRATRKARPGHTGGRCTRCSDRPWNSTRHARPRSIGGVTVVLLRGPHDKPFPHAEMLRHMSHSGLCLRHMSQRVRGRENGSMEIHRRPALTVAHAGFHNEDCSGVHAVLRAETVIRTRELEPVSTGGRRALTPAASPLPGWASSWGDLRSNHSHEGAPR